MMRSWSRSNFRHNERDLTNPATKRQDSFVLDEIIIDIHSLRSLMDANKLLDLEETIV